MDTHSTAARTKFYIGTTADALNLAAFEADTYVEVKSLVDLGEFGDEAEIVTYNTIDAGRVFKLKGSRDAGSMEIVVVRDALDAGQLATAAAAADDFARNFKIVLDDKPNPTGSATEFFFRGMVMTAKNEIGEADNMIKTKFTVAINSAVIEVPAEAGV